MNEDTKKAIDALAGGKTDGVNPGGDVDWKARCEEAERKLQSAMVEQGRVKKLDESNKELQRKLEEALSARIAKSVIDEIPADVKGDIAQDVLEVNAEIAKRTADKAGATLRSELRGEIDALKEQFSMRDEQFRAEQKQRFAERVEREFPGFFASAVTEGGDKHKAWVEYQKYNSASISTATNAFDFDTLAWHIRRFYTNELGIAPPSVDSRVAADPSSIGGGTPTAVKHGKVYTQQEISDLYDEVEKARDRGNFDEAKRLGDEIEKAMRDGRVK